MSSYINDPKLKHELLNIDIGFFDLRTTGAQKLNSIKNNSPNIQQIISSITLTFESGNIDIEVEKCEFKKENNSYNWITSIPKEKFQAVISSDFSLKLDINYENNIKAENFCIENILNIPFNNSKQMRKLDDEKIKEITNVSILKLEEEFLVHF